MNLEKLYKHLADEHSLLLLESEKREIADCLHDKKQSEFDWDIIRIYIAIVVFVLLFIIAMMV